MKENKRDKRVLIPRDEFEEEAGEGLGRLSREEAEADLRELSARMERRMRRPRAIWLPAAAAVVILLVGSALLVTMLRDRPGLESEVALADESITDTAYIALAGTIEKDKSAASGEVNTGAVSGAVNAGAAMAESKKAAYGPLLTVVEKEVSEALIADEEMVEKVAEAQEEPDDVVFAVVQEEQAEEVIVQAVPQMTKAAMKTREETADRTAMKTREETADRTAMKTRAETADRAAEVHKNVVPDGSASPVVGWSEYSDYVVRNIRYPEGITPVIRQEVLVSFTVQADSTLSDLKAVRSPAEAFTLEAFRLLREGPGWIPASIGGQVTSEVVVVRFVFR